MTEYAGVQKGHLRRYRFAERFINKLAPYKWRILDAACGFGYGSHILHESGHKVCGIEFNPTTIEQAKLDYPGPGFVFGDILQKPWAGQFDAVVSFETLEHIVEAPQVVASFYESLYPNGILIASVPNENRYKFKPEKFARDFSPHVRHYTPEEFYFLLDKEGFTVTGMYCQVDKLQEVTPGTDGRFLIYTAVKEA